ncbi:GNAT family N-acetyltransferase [Phenylobacterium sp.]|uniref:GNAT family N-acetyltransferase n=1 Tax=Phenylobacterium sp. TaxID=1871053 RepID=UPI002E31D56B|nr:GNAT family N-acetyltransferase [Phenylobacterium sp.]HEX2559144.1 GNAT family N-acetyltransferase [Phenylobacterium sp.]
MPIARDIVLATPRLILRPSGPEDARRFFEIQSNWNVTRMLRFPEWPARFEAMAAWVATHPGEWDAGTGYRFAVTLDSQVIGMTDVDEVAMDSPSLGYWFDEAFWGRGFAREAAGAVVAFTFGRLGFDHMVSGCLAENTGSARVLEMLGFRPTEAGVRWVKPRQETLPYRSYRLQRDRFAPA